MLSPSTITVPEGQTSSGLVQLTVTGVASGTTTLVASAAGLSSATVNVTVTSKPELQLRTYLGTNATAVGKGMRTYSAEVSVALYTDAQQYNAPQPVTVNLRRWTCDDKRSGCGSAR